jgi:hypothetical protein
MAPALSTHHAQRLGVCREAATIRGHDPALKIPALTAHGKRQDRGDEQTHQERQNSEFSMWATMYKNTAQATVRLTVDGDRYVANDVLS